MARVKGTVKEKAVKTSVTKPAKVEISKDDMYLFGNGTHYEIYKKLGAHVSAEKGVKGVYFGLPMRRE